MPANAAKRSAACFTQVKSKRVKIMILPSSYEFTLLGGPLYNEGAEDKFGDCAQSNRSLLTSMKPDSNEEALHKIAWDDYEKGRMSKPSRVADACVDQVNRLKSSSL